MVAEEPELVQRAQQWGAGELGWLKVMDAFFSTEFVILQPQRPNSPHRQLDIRRADGHVFLMAYTTVMRARLAAGGPCNGLRATGQSIQDRILPQLPDITAIVVDSRDPHWLAFPVSASEPIVMAYPPAPTGPLPGYPTSSPRPSRRTSP